MNVLILGAGEMGCLYGAAFHRAGFPVLGFDVDASRALAALAGREPSC